MSERLEAVAELIALCGEETSAKAITSALTNLAKVIQERDEAQAAANAFAGLLAEMAENGHWNPAGITWKVFEEHPGWPRAKEA